MCPKYKNNSYQGNGFLSAEVAKLKLYDLKCHEKPAFIWLFLQSMK